MSRKTQMLAAAVGATLISSAAQASVSFVGLSQVPIPAAAIAADSTLANYTSYDLVVSISAGDHWAAGGLLGTLSSGNFYNSPTFNGDTGKSQFAALVPTLENDTFVSRPGYADPGDGAILGSFSGAAQATFPGTTNASRINNPAKIDVAWGDANATANNLAGIQAIARLTISNSNFGGTAGPAFIAPGGNQFTGVLKVTSDANAASPIAFSLAVPEPTSLALMGLGLGAVALRRRK